MALTEEEKQEINQTIGMYVVIDTDNFRQMMSDLPGPDKTDVVIDIDGEKHKMTLEEFKDKIKA